MTRSVATFLMFDGVAEEAMKFYTSVFGDSEVRRIQRFGPGEQGAEGSVKRADFSVAGHNLIFFDSPVKHAFTFTPSISIFVECENATELESAFKQLSEGGQILMALDNYGFSTRFGWLNDRFGVSWQLNLP
jgi:predicted 3-demethylubiquinone-9 3-methyltransferase (glyoxalase superfamily)